jgi:hypothetical protein
MRGPTGVAVSRPPDELTPTQALAAHDISRLLGHPDRSTIALVAFLLGSATALCTPISTSLLHAPRERRVDHAQHTTS